MRMTNENGDTALHKAVRSEHVDVVKIILKKEEDPEFEYPTNKAGETPLYLAAESGFIDILREILESCKNPNYAGGPFGRTPLHAAVVHEHSGNENDWTTAIHIAAGEVDTLYVTNVLSELLHHNPDCWEMLDSRGQNALHVAVMNGQAALLLTLLKSENWGSLVDEPDNDGNTPMHLFAFGKYFNKDEILQRKHYRNCVPYKLIIHPKAKKMTFNKDDQTPLDIFSRAVTEKSNREVSTCRHLITPSLQFYVKVLLFGSQTVFLLLIFSSP
ncbi:ankyrin repeat-containing protein At5g02620-like isoform X3 [Lycium barbarum]|uniref:ankyrin repeat-containing protein At5g02620-like isoform X3 n=1 Tax=Lycium barbarum TaxID=112863 RepID=UPI00293EA7B5|nr:ankyrin repeat-containing protein At5g02620-like isoform X3 [Lycium barbarum]